MKKKLIWALVITFAIVLILCVSNRIPQKDTNLEFWIAENVENVDFSNYEEKFGLMGGRDTLPNPAYTYIVMEATESNLLVAEIGEDGKAIDTKQYSVPNWFHPSTEIKAGYKITIKHNDKILETFPMRFSEIYSMEYYDRKTGLSTVVIAD